MGYEVHVAIENRGNIDLAFCDKVFYLPFKRSPLNQENKIAYKQLKNIILDETYKIIHCHTPAVSVLTRLAARKAKKSGTKVFYTAHGFHFYKGGDTKNWLIYYPIEKILARFTDVIITINQDDFLLAKEKFTGPAIYKISGMGVDNNRFHQISNELQLIQREKLGFLPNEIIVVCIGELNRNKNQKFILQSLLQSEKKYDQLKLLIIGKGDEEINLHSLISGTWLENKVQFLGWQNDAAQYIKIADIGVSASIREGFGIALVEEMLCGCAVIASENRGHKEIIEHNKNGFLFKLNDKNSFITYFDRLYESQELRINISQLAISQGKKFTLDNTLQMMKKIYISAIQNK